MFNSVKKCKRLFNFVGFLLEKNQKFINNEKPLRFILNSSSELRFFSFFQMRSLLVASDNHQLSLTRNKSKDRGKKRNRYSNEEESSDEEEEEEEEEDDEDDEEQVLERGTEIKTYKVNSLRTDLILKTLFGFSRKKIEENFYENKIRINGNLLLKKSHPVEEGDEIDIIKKIEDHFKNTLNIGRIKILKAKYDSDSERFIIKAWKAKSLVIENYDGVNSWKEDEEIN